MNLSLLHKLRTDGDAFGITPLYGAAKCIVVGFSGGADSSLLLTYLASMGEVPVCALHVNHMIRGAEADGDEDFCRRRCAELGVPFAVVRADVPELARERGLGLEECARAVRYDAANDVRDAILRGECPFEGVDRLPDEIAERHGTVLFATAHNGDDNLETVIFNLVRGAGSAGISGITPVREDGVIRPLLGLSGNEVRRICADEGIDFVTDSTNAGTDYTRNFIRHRITPLMRELNPSVTDAVMRCSSALREDDRYLTRAAARIAEEHLPRGGGLSDRAEMPREALRALPDPILARVLRIMVAAVTPVAMGDGHIRTAGRLIRETGTGEVSLPGGVTLEVSKLCVTAERNRDYSPFSFEVSLPEAGQVLEYSCPEGGFDLLLARSEADIPPEGKNIYKLAIHTAVRFDTIYGRVLVRSLSPGDSYVLGGHRRRIKKMLSDRGVRRSLRCRLPVICDGRGVIAVPGLPVRGESYAPPGCDALYIACTFR